MTIERIPMSIERVDAKNKYIDQALKEISELIDGAKPERWLADPVTKSDTTAYFKARGHDDAIDQYQSNLKELLK